MAEHALLALWNDVDPVHDAAYEDWHAREHVPERLRVPGFVWALRFRRSGTGVLPSCLTLYGLRDAQVLASAAYRRLLAEPTPASRAMRPALRNVGRWVCRLELDEGIARHTALVVSLVDRDAPSLAARGGCARLVATRCADAAPLPWLAAAQAVALAGERLDVLAGAAGSLPMPAGGTGYRRCD